MYVSSSIKCNLIAVLPPCGGWRLTTRSVLAAHICQENPPLVIEEAFEGGFIRVADWSKVDWVKTKLFQVAKCQIPGQESVQVVESDSRWAEESVIVRTYAHFDTVGEKWTSGVRAQIVLITKNLIRYRAAFDTDVLVFDLLNEVGMHLEIESVPNALSAEQDSVKKLGVRALVWLTSVQIQLETISKLHLDCEDLLNKFIDSGIVVFFVNQVEAWDQVSFRISRDKSIKLRLNVVFAKHLKATNYQAHTEERIPPLDRFYAFVKDCKFFF